MLPVHDLTPSQLIAHSRLFSASVLQELGRMGKSPLFSRLARETGLNSRLAPTSTVANVFEAAFATLKSSSRRDEYIYKAALTHRVLLGKHSLRTASMLSEFRIGGCKADIVILNGTATVYEIKSERDSLTRLGNQIQTYRKVFAKVNVIAAERFVEDILLQTDDEVGVLMLNGRSQIKTIREAKDGASQICPLMLFDSLRTVEAMETVSALGINIPEVPNTVIRRELRELFSQLKPEKLHQAAVRVLKESRSQLTLRDHIAGLPPSLAAATLTTSLTQSERRSLTNALATSFSNALTWA